MNEKPPPKVHDELLSDANAHEVLFNLISTVPIEDRMRIVRGFMKRTGHTLERVEELFAPYGSLKKLLPTEHITKNAVDVVKKKARNHTPVKDPQAAKERQERLMLQGFDEATIKRALQPRQKPKDDPMI